jgi:putative solute:sodium symporter small subunit
MAATRINRPPDAGRAKGGAADPPSEALNVVLPEEDPSMQLSQKHHEYWNRNLKVTAILLFIWFVVTFVASWFARELNSVVILGFPLGFYMGAQGSLIVYVAIIWYYARYMNELDQEYGVHEGEDD